MGFNRGQIIEVLNIKSNFKRSGQGRAHLEIVAANEDVAECGAAEPVADRVRAEEAATEKLPSRHVHLLLSGGQQRGHDGGLAGRVAVQVTASSGLKIFNR